MIWAFYADDHQGKFSNGEVGWARGEWIRALARHYREKPYLLLCPQAQHRRAAAGGPVEVRRPLNAPESQLAEYGGPHTAYNFPTFDGDHEPGAKFLVSSYGANNWIYDARADICELPSAPCVSSGSQICSMKKQSTRPSNPVPILGNLDTATINGLMNGMSSPANSAVVPLHSGAGSGKESLAAQADNLVSKDRFTMGTVGFLLESIRLELYVGTFELTGILLFPVDLPVHMLNYGGFVLIPTLYHNRTERREPTRTYKK